MSFFGRDSEAKSKPVPPQPQPRPVSRPAPAVEAPRRSSTRIASGSKVVGEISGSAELVIHGEVQGQVNLESRVTVGPDGRVEGEIEAREVEVAGKVRGNVRGHGRVEVQPSGSLEGDVISPRVVIAEGAFFKGQVDMTETRAAKKPGRKTEPTGKPEPAKPPAGPQTAAASEATEEKATDTSKTPGPEADPNRDRSAGAKK